MKKALFSPSAEWYPLSGRGKLVFQWLPEKKKSILDIGCGSCFITRHFLRKCNEVYGMDTSCDSIYLASGWYPGLRLVRGNMENIPFRNTSFDVVTAIEVLEHTENDGLAVAEVERLLGPGGTFILTVPHRGLFYFLDAANFRKNFHLFDKMRDFKEHRHYTIAQISNLLKDHFQIVNVETRGFIISEFLYLVMVKFFRHKNFITVFLQKMIDLDIMVKYGRMGSLLIVKAVKKI